MANNPLENSPERDRRIRERAYHLWEKEGRPHGRDADYWERARELEAIAESTGSAQKPAPDPDAPLMDTPIEEAFLQDNLGEFPDRVSDQGEHQATPTAGRRSTTPVQPEPVRAEPASAKALGKKSKGRK